MGLYSPEQIRAATYEADCKLHGKIKIGFWLKRGKKNLASLFFKLQSVFLKSQKQSSDAALLRIHKSACRNRLENAKNKGLDNFS